jgi:hypothetical protein
VGSCGASATVSRSTAAVGEICSKNARSDSVVGCGIPSSWRASVKSRTSWSSIWSRAVGSTSSSRGGSPRVGAGGRRRIAMRTGLLLYLQRGCAQPQPLVLGPGIVVGFPHRRAAADCVVVLSRNACRIRMRAAVNSTQALRSRWRRSRISRRAWPATHRRAGYSQCPGQCLPMRRAPLSRGRLCDHIDGSRASSTAVRAENKCSALIRRPHGTYCHGTRTDRCTVVAEVRTPERGFGSLEAAAQARVQHSPPCPWSRSVAIEDGTCPRSCLQSGGG